MARTLEEALAAAEARIKELENEVRDLKEDLSAAKVDADYWRGEYHSVVC